MLRVTYVRPARRLPSWTYPPISPSAYPGRRLAKSSCGGRSHFDAKPAYIPDNHILLRVDRFGFSANNITYQALGEHPRYRYDCVVF